jgi:hypothetical protein
MSLYEAMIEDLNGAIRNVCAFPRHVSSSTTGRYMALFKVVLCA